MKNRKLIWKICIVLVLLGILLVHLYPILLIFISAVKTKAEMAANPFGFPKEITWEYFIKAADKMQYGQSVWNSALIVVVVVGILLLTSSMAAYAISRRGGIYNIFYFIFLVGMLVPFQMIMIPLYKYLMNFHMINKLSGVMCVYLATLAPFSVFLLTGFIKSVPKELEESAYLDGAGCYRAFFAIIFPLLRPSLATVAVLNAFTIWNDYLMPMLYLQSKDKLTLTVTLANFQGMYFNDWSMIFAGVCLIVLPILILYLLAQKYIIGGMTAGAVKG